MSRWKLLSLAFAACLMGPAFTARADPWKDESGNGKQPRYAQPYYGQQYYAPPQRRSPPGYGYAEPIPSGHLPPPGECRVWYPGVPPGQQPPPFRC
jgi:hypothetical protein